MHLHTLKSIDDLSRPHIIVVYLFDQNGLFHVCWRFRQKALAVRTPTDESPHHPHQPASDQCEFFSQVRKTTPHIGPHCCQWKWTFPELFAASSPLIWREAPIEEVSVPWLRRLLVWFCPLLFMVFWNKNIAINYYSQFTTLLSVVTAEQITSQFMQVFKQDLCWSRDRGTAG